MENYKRKKETPKFPGRAKRNIHIMNVDLKDSDIFCSVFKKPTNINKYVPMYTENCSLG